MVASRAARGSRMFPSLSMFGIRENVKTPVVIYTFYQYSRKSKSIVDSRGWRVHTLSASQRGVATEARSWLISFTFYILRHSIPPEIFSLYVY